jgi:hypothetical protein
MTVETLHNETVSRSPEHQDMIDRLTALTQLPAEYLEQTPYDPNAFQGIGVRDIANMMSQLYPEDDPDTTKVKSARLFNRIAIETHDLPVPDDLSGMDTTSETARMDPFDVMRYGATHLRHRMDLTNPAELASFNGLIENTVDRALNARDHFDPAEHEATIQQIGNDAKTSLSPASRYPTLAEY